MRQLGAISVKRIGPKLTHGAGHDSVPGQLRSLHFNDYHLKRRRRQVSARMRNGAVAPQDVARVSGFSTYCAVSQLRINVQIGEQHHGASCTPYARAAFRSRPARASF